MVFSGEIFDHGFARGSRSRLIWRVRIERDQGSKTKIELRYAKRRWKFDVGMVATAPSRKRTRVERAVAARDDGRFINDGDSSGASPAAVFDAIYA